MPITIQPATLKIKNGNAYYSADSLKGDDADISIIAPDYSDLTFPIANGKLCTHDRALYKATQEILTREEWTAAHWTTTTNEDEIENGFVVHFSTDYNMETVTVTESDADVLEALSQGKTLFGELEVDMMGQGSFVMKCIAKTIYIDMQSIGTGHMITFDFKYVDGDIVVTGSYEGVNDGPAAEMYWEIDFTSYLKYDASADAFNAYRKKIANIDDPTDNTDAANKRYVDQALNAPVTVSGTTPTITAKSGVRYICGECSTLTINVPETGCVDVLFNSGSTPTVLTVQCQSGAVSWANGFDPDNLESGKTYEINILNMLGVAGVWDTPSVLS